MGCLCPNAGWKKKAPGEERGIFGRGELGCVCICGCVYAEMRLSVYVTRFFSRYVSPFFSLSTQIKKKPEIVYSSCLFINCYFLEIKNTHVSCTTIIEQHRRHKKDDDLLINSVYRNNRENVFRSFRLALEDRSVCDNR